jgi:ATP-dependent Clp protease ATP-binding subunit ClpB
LDEIEKAHGDVFNVLLQILDDGRLTDGQGRTVDFKNTVVIMTSNVGSREIAEAGTDEEMRAGVLASLRAQFRPEFLNRIDEVLIFKRLSEDQVGRIVDIQLALLQKRLAERRVTLSLTAKARAALGKAGFDPDYGARPLKRAIQKEIVDPLARKLLAGEFKEGDAIDVDAAKGGSLEFRRTSAKKDSAS